MKISKLQENIIRLKLIPLIGNKTMVNIFKNFPDLKERYFDFDEIKDFLTPTQIKNFQSKDDSFFEKNFEILLKNFEKNSIKLLDLFDSDYPFQLSKTFNPPILLFVKGDLDFAYDTSIAIVGTRNFSDYGRSHCIKFVQEIKDSGFTIISGLARGIDSIALSEGIKTNQKCIGVIGSGFDFVYPASNYRLYENILKNNGAIVTEYFPFEMAHPGFFPARNRIIAGLSKSTFVVEAAEKSGSLITAASAFEEGRDVYALPADINRIGSQGCNEIIRKGIAKLINSPENILEEYGFSSKSNENIFDFITNEDHKNILKEINTSPLSSDELTLKFKTNINNLNILLSEMEVLGMIEKGLDEKWRIK